MGDQQEVQGIYGQFDDFLREGGAPGGGGGEADGSVGSAAGSVAAGGVVVGGEIGYWGAGYTFVEPNTQIPLFTCDLLLKLPGE